MRMNKADENDENSHKAYLLPAFDARWREVNNFELKILLSFSHDLFENKLMPFAYICHLMTE